MTTAFDMYYRIPETVKVHEVEFTRGNSGLITLECLALICRFEYTTDDENEALSALQGHEDMND